MEYTIDCSAIHSTMQMHRILKKTLSFPDWYGNNLDALYDCLTELPQQTHLILLHWRSESRFLARFHSVFADAQQDHPLFTFSLQ